MKSFVGNIKKHNILLIISLITILLVSCSQKNNKLKIAVAANFSSTLKEIVDSFYVNSKNLEIDLIVGSSGKLAGQILSGADFDIFLSADSSKPFILFEKRKLKNRPVIYANGALSLFSVNPELIPTKLEKLECSKLNYIAISNPNLAPYGKAAFEVISNTGLNIDTSKYVYGQNILQTFQHACLAADIGFVSKSLLLSSSASEKYLEGINWIEIYDSLYNPIKQFMIKIHEKSPNVEKFYNYMQSPEAKKIINKNGYKI